MIDSQKSANNKIMDELVEKLGYMDYRDVLTCNKYILEAKRSQDYHQMARAKILQVAMQKQTVQRKNEIELSVNKEFQDAKPKSKQERDDLENAKQQAKLDILMKQDPDLASMFQHSVKEIREEKEYDVNNINRIHERFDYIKEPDNLRNKLKNELYDVVKQELPEDDIEMSTEFTDEYEQDFYQRYKTMMYEEKDDKEYYERERQRIIDLRE